MTAGKNQSSESNQTAKEPGSARSGEGDGAQQTATEQAAALQRELRQRFPQVKRLEVLPLAEADGYVVVAQLTDDSTERERLGLEFVAFGADRGVLLHPLLYTVKEWIALERILPAESWLPQIVDREEPVHLVELYRRHRQYPADLRRLLVAAIRHQLAFFNFVQQSVLLPSYLSVALGVRAMREALSLIFATQGLQFEENLRAIELFDQHFAKSSYFTRNDILLYFHLRGIERQARHFFHFTLDEETDFAWQPAVRHVIAFLEAFKRYVVQQLSTEAERQRARARRWLFAGGPAVLALVAALGYMIGTRPAAPAFELSDRATMVRPGGITGHYFSGMNFDKEVLVRSEPTLNFSTPRELVAGLPPDFFSIRWTGHMRFKEGGKYQLCARYDDALRVSFNNKRIIDDWKPGPARRTCADVRVREGWYPLSIEYYERKEVATLQLLRGTDKQSLRIVHPSDLCCRQADEARPPVQPVPAPPPSKATVPPETPTPVKPGVAPTPSKPVVAPRPIKPVVAPPAPTTPPKK